MLAETVDADRAERIGLINRVVPMADLDRAVAEWAEQLGGGPAIALASTKRLLNQGGHIDLGTALAAEAAAQAINSGTDDLAEALAAFAERRAPVFKGR